MIVKPSQRAAVVNALRSALDAAGLNSVGIMADESSNTGNFINEAPTWLGAAAGSIAAVAHHQYGFGTLYNPVLAWTLDTHAYLY